MILIFIATLFLLSTLSLVIIKDKLYRSIILVISIWWILWLFISSFNFFNTFEVSVYAYFLLLLFVGMFFLGYIVSYTTSSAKKSFSLKENTLERIFKSELLNKINFKIISFLFMLLLAYYFYKYRQAFIAYGILEARTLRYSVGPVFSTAIEAHFFNYVVTAFNYINMLIVALSINLKKIFTFNFFVSFLSVLFYTGIGAGRNTLIGLGCFIIIIYLISNYSSRSITKLSIIKKSKNHLTLIVSGSILVILTGYVTAVRMGFKTLNYEAVSRASNSLFEQIILYCTGAFRAFDYAIRNSPFGDTPFFGKVTLGGLDQLIGSILTFLGYNYTIANYHISNIGQESINIGLGVTHNAHYTQLIAFYLDFGVFGIVIFSFMLGWITNRVVLSFVSKPTIPSLLIVLIMCDSMIRGLLNWRLGTVDILLVFIIAIIWAKRNNRKNLKIGY